MSANNIEEQTDSFSRRRTLLSGAGLLVYLGVVFSSRSLIFAVAGGVALLVIRSWAIDRILYANGIAQVALLDQSLQRSVVDAKRQRAQLDQLLRETRAHRQPSVAVGDDWDDCDDGSDDAEISDDGLHN